ncbi:MAG: nucleotidyltransferase domain-containing protein [Candidatus Woesearchaeota archaeon]
MLQNYTKLKVASVFFINPTKDHYLKQISRDLKIAHTSVKNYLDEFVKSGIIKKISQKRGKRTFPVYKANYNDSVFRYYKSIFNFLALNDSGLINHLNDLLISKSIVLFGSFQRGEDVEDSDIDIFIECSKKEINLKKFEKILKRKIQLHFNNNFPSYPKELKNNIINGTVLSGFLEGYK